MFHAAGLYSFINISVYRASPIFFSVDRPLSSDLVVETLQKIDAEATFLPPAILEDMSQDETCVKALAKLNFIVFGGGKSTHLCAGELAEVTNIMTGNLAREAGNRLIKAGAPLANMIAATE